jgi:hypothetical protein
MYYVSNVTLARSFRIDAKYIAVRSTLAEWATLTGITLVL